MKNKFSVISVLIFFILASSLELCIAQFDYQLRTNRLSIGIDNQGVLADVFLSPIQFCKGCYDDKTFLYSAGFYLGGKNGDSIWVNSVSSSDRNFDYIPGNVDSISTNPDYKLYVIKKEPPFNSTWEDYRKAVNKGAMFYNGDGDNFYNPVDLNGNGQWDLNEDCPDILGDITTWCVFNDGKPANQRKFNNVNPLGIEIHQTVWAYTTTNPNDARSSSFFVRYKIINTGKVSQTLDSVYFAAWSDTDLGELNDAYLDDLGGCDTIHNSTYIFNDGVDPHWGINPPAHFTRILQGPFVFIPGVTFTDINGNGEYDDLIDFPLDTAYNHLGQFIGREEIIGAKNLNMTSSFFNIINHYFYGIPGNKYEAWNYFMSRDRIGGLISACTHQLGQVQSGVNCNNINPKYIFSGDPVSNYGWINIMPYDYRQMAITGPFKLKVGKPVTIIVAHIVGRGYDALNSITVGRAYNSAVTQFYKNNFASIPLSVQNNQPTHIVNDYELYQNYPNPFNPQTKIKFSVPELSFVKLSVFDILGKEVRTIVNDWKTTGEYVVEFDGSELPSGVYLYQIKAGNYVETKKMILIK
ncbi:MAG: T9SS type A sorting domain-containing protein [Ignavibacterium sp.]|nr:T9SS type A sorting domain-containing protein [Ignavibacterium sp.]MDW8374709.1 T9SS type A sorting domain-containing protein [Ignavibacteriales bacterium]